MRHPDGVVATSSPAISAQGTIIREQHTHRSSCTLRNGSMCSSSLCKALLQQGDLAVDTPKSDCKAGLLDLPEPILQLILMLSGSGGAAAASSCRTLRRSFVAALSCPELAARFLLRLYGRETALFRLYGTSGLRSFLARCVQGLNSPATVDSIVTELLKLGAALKSQERFLLTAASGAGDTLVVRTLLRAGVSAGACGGRALVAASAAGHVAVMELLLRAGVSARAENGMPLRAACREGQVAAARLLLRHGADPRAAASGALVDSASGGNLALVLELLASGADPRVDGSRALVEAAAAGHGCVVLALLVAGAQPNARNGLALRRAAEGGHTTVVRMLQQAAADAVAAPAAPPAEHGSKGGGGAATSRPRPSTPLRMASPVNAAASNDGSGGRGECHDAIAVRRPPPLQAVPTALPPLPPAQPGLCGVDVLEAAAPCAVVGLLLRALAQAGSLASGPSP